MHKTETSELKMPLTNRDLDLLRMKVQPRIENAEKKTTSCKKGQK